MFPVNTLSQWSSITANGGASPGAVLVDITPLGNVSAGSIRIAITDAGAGVRHAGRTAAGVGDFTIAADGKVELVGGRVSAAQDLIVSAPPGTTTLPTLAAGPGAAGNAYSLVADRHVDLAVGAATITGGTIAAGSPAVGGDVTLGIDNVNATGPFALAGRDTGAGYEPVSITARGGGFGLFAETQDARLSGVTITANQRALAVARDFTLESPLAADGRRRTSSLAAGSVEGDFAGAFVQRGAVIQGASDTPELRNAIKNQLVAREVFAQEAKKRNLDRDPQVIAAVEEARTNAMVTRYLSEAIKPAPVSDADVRARYDAIVATLGPEEYKLRVILVADRARAEEAIVAARLGRPFPALAQQYSIAPSAARGGELDWVSFKTPPEEGKTAGLPLGVAQAIVAMKPGEVSVPLAFGDKWIVVRLDEKRPTAVPTFEQARGAIHNMLAARELERATTELVTALMKNTKITE